MADVVFGQVHIIPWERKGKSAIFLLFLEFLLELRGRYQFRCVFIENRLGIDREMIVI